MFRALGLGCWRSGGSGIGLPFWCSQVSDGAVSVTPALGGMLSSGLPADFRLRVPGQVRAP